MFDPIRLPLSSEAEKSLERDLFRRLSALKTGLKPFHETNLVTWRRIYEAQPAEKTRDFPFQNASNLIVPVAGIHCDTLKARVMSSVWKTRPLWLANIVGVYGGQMDDVRDAWQTFLLDNALEPTELDLYRVESEFFGEIIKYGTSFLKCPYVKKYEDYVVPAGDGTQKYEIMREPSYMGPRPEKTALEDMFFSPSAKTLEECDLIAHRIRYQKHELLERRFTQFFKANKVDAILSSPDRHGPDYVTKQREEDMNARTSVHDDYAEWDVYECYLPYRAQNSNKSPRVIVWYHLKTKTILNAIFDQYSQILKTRPFVMGRLLYRDDSLLGYGLCEVLEMLQEEISVMHNQRRDNVLVANTKVWRVDPQSKLHQGYQIYPSAMLPAIAGEIEPLQHGEVASITIDEERLSMDLAERRSGVSPPMQGMGAGSNTKRGVYTAMGTLSLLQEGNSRTDLNIMDIRYSHTKVGRMLSKLYAHMGVDESKLACYGEMAELIKGAAELIRRDKLRLPISSSTASVNKEIEKQNDLMLAQIMAKHYGMVTQLMQQAATAVLSKEIREYSIKVIEASDRLMKQILRHFDHDDVDALVPRPMLAQQNQGQPGGQQPQGGQPNAQRQPTPFPSQPSLDMPVQPPNAASAGILAGMVNGGAK